MSTGDGAGCRSDSGNGDGALPPPFGDEWQGRQEALALFDQIVTQSEEGRYPGIGKVHAQEFLGPIQTIIPWATNLYTESIIARVQEEFGKDFWGFWMLGGMSGGGMGFLFHPSRKREAQTRLQEIMSAEKRRYEHGIPFAMEPVVYDFAINEQGSSAEVLAGEKTVLPQPYYALTVPSLLRKDPRTLSPSSDRSWSISPPRAEPIRHLKGCCSVSLTGSCPIRWRSQRITRPWKSCSTGTDSTGSSTSRSRRICGADGSDSPQNRLPISTTITDVEEGDVVDMSGARRHGVSQDWSRRARIRGCRGAHARGRSREPMDERCRHGEGAESVLPDRGRTPHVHRDASGKEPSHDETIRDGDSSYDFHGLPDARCHQTVPGR